MPFVIPGYTDGSGNVCEASYWRATTVNIDDLAQAILVVFAGWKDQASHGGGLAPLVGARRIYHISGATFAALAAQAPSGATLYEVVANAAESYALASLDARDAQGNPASFFAGATRTSS